MHLFACLTFLNPSFILKPAGLTHLCLKLYDRVQAAFQHFHRFNFCHQHKVKANTVEISGRTEESHVVCLFSRRVNSSFSSCCSHSSAVIAGEGECSNWVFGLCPDYLVGRRNKNQEKSLYFSQMVHVVHNMTTHRHCWFLAGEDSVPCLSCVWTAISNPPRAGLTSWLIQMERLETLSVYLQLHTHCSLLVSLFFLSGPRFSQSLPFDCTDSHQGRNSNSLEHLLHMVALLKPAV